MPLAAPATITAMLFEVIYLSSCTANGDEGPRSKHVCPAAHACRPCTRGRIVLPAGSWPLPRGCVAARLRPSTTCESHRHAYRPLHAIARLYHRPSLHGTNGGTSGLRFDLVCRASRCSGREREPFSGHGRRDPLDLFAFHGTLHCPRARVGGDGDTEAGNRDHFGAAT